MTRAEEETTGQRKPSKTIAPTIKPNDLGLTILTMPSMDVTLWFYPN